MKSLLRFNIKYLREKKLYHFLYWFYLTYNFMALGWKHSLSQCLDCAAGMLMRTSKFYAFELIKMNSTICAAVAYLQEQGLLTGGHRRAEYRCFFSTWRSEQKCRAFQ